jgi:similar to stage IV sporulation protein
MSKAHSHHDVVTIRLTSADIGGALQQLTNHRVTIHDVVYVDALHLDITISAKDLSQLQTIASKKGYTVQILHGSGFRQVMKGIWKRPVLVLGILALFFLSCWLPTRVLFIRVEGNVKVPTMQIVEQAKLCGIDFGASRRQVRSELMKNRLLCAMPQLQWAGITTSGCTAVITVRERNDLEMSIPVQSFNNMIALRDAVVGEMIVRQGTPLCRPGQVVKQGQLLVSAYEDCGICIRATGAQAEIYGQTQRQITAVYPTNYAKREVVTSVSKKYSVIIGKKRIKFYKGSGISGGTCAKIYEEKCITLPGGFVLPIAIACEQTIEYRSEVQRSPLSEVILSAFAQQYLSERMQSGKILDSNQVYFHADGFCRLDGNYSCYEIIGISRPEEHRKAYE